MSRPTPFSERTSEFRYRCPLLNGIHLAPGKRIHATLDFSTPGLIHIGIEIAGFEAENQVLRQPATFDTASETVPLPSGAKRVEIEAVVTRLD
jgi:hypothetical protein